MPPVSLREVPFISGLKVDNCTVEQRSGEVRITYVVQANEKMLALFKKSIHAAEDYAGYNKWHATSRCLIVLVSCRDKETPAQTAMLFTTTVVGIMQKELEAAEVKSTGKSYRDIAPGYKRPQRRQQPFVIR